MSSSIKSCNNNVNDSCIPDILKDFVFDLHDSVRTSQIPSEQSILYASTFHEITAKYFSQSAWPSTSSISAECNNDPLFLALYSELTLRHHHSISRPLIRDRVDGWHSYRSLFDLLLKESEERNTDNKGIPTTPFYLLPEWTFDMLHEFVYQFQGFCQCRTAAYANASKYASQAAATAAHAAAEGEEVGKNVADETKEEHNHDSTNQTTKGDDGKNEMSKIVARKEICVVPQQLPHHIKESIDTLSSNRDAWAVETVLFYLHRLVTIGAEQMEKQKRTNNGNITNTYYHFGVFASVTLSRLECLLGDYTASLDALGSLASVLFDSPLMLITASSTSSAISSSQQQQPTPSQLVHGVFAARLSVAYHAGVSYLMLRRYKDAIYVLGNMCSALQRGFKSGRLHGVIPTSSSSMNGGERGGDRDRGVNATNIIMEQFGKLYDRMIALLAILTHACPIITGSNATSNIGNGSAGCISTTVDIGGLDDSIMRVVSERHRSQLSKIEAGEEGYEDMFMFACPKFISPAVPDYESAKSTVSGGEGGDVVSRNVTQGISRGGGGQEAYKLQVRHFMNEMASQQTMRKLRSYMKLYTSISVEKLGRLVLEEEFESLLLSYKHKMRQIEVVRGFENGGNIPTAEGLQSVGRNDDNGKNASDITTIKRVSSIHSVDLKSALDGQVGTVVDLHYYIKDDVIYVNEAERQNRFESYFVSKISQCNDIMKDLEGVTVHI